jgi:hypothetical protein
MSTRKVLAALAIAAATACGTATTAAATPAPDTQSCAALDAGQICHIHADGQGYTVDFSFPVGYPDQQAVADYVKNRQADVAGYAADRHPQERPYELDADATVYRSPSAGTESLVFEEYTDLGGAHPVTGYQAFNYDLNKGSAITFDTLFKPGTDPVAVLDPIVRREFEKRFADYGRVGDNTLGAKTYRSFAITDDAVIFFIGQGMWMPEVAGPQHVSVPRSELAALLA